MVIHTTVIGHSEQSISSSMIQITQHSNEFTSYDDSR